MTIPLHTSQIPPTNGSRTLASLAALLGVKGQIALRLRYLQLIQRLSTMPLLNPDSGASLGVCSCDGRTWAHHHHLRSLRHRLHCSRTRVSRTRSTFPSGNCSRACPKVDRGQRRRGVNRNSDRSLPGISGIPGSSRQLRAQVRSPSFRTQYA